MFCNQCGKTVPDNAQFCANCGNRLQAVTPQKPKKSKKNKPLLIILGIWVGLLLFGLSINLLDIYVFNSAKKLEEKLMDETWYSEPREAVAVAGGERMMTAYSLEFHDDGTATVTTYITTGFGELDPEDMEVYETETVDWEISSNRTLEFDGDDYKCKTLLGDADDRWYLKDGCLHLYRTYYDKDEWDYAS